MPPQKKLDDKELSQARETGIIDAMFGYEKANPYDRNDARWQEYENGYRDQKQAKKFDRAVFTRR